MNFWYRSLQNLDDDLEFQLSRSCQVKDHDARLKVIQGFIFVCNVNHVLISNHLKYVSSHVVFQGHQRSRSQVTFKSYNSNKCHCLKQFHLLKCYLTRKSRFVKSLVNDLEFLLSRSCQVKGHDAKLKVIYKFLYVGNTNYGPIFHRFGDIRHFVIFNFDLQRPYPLADLAKKQKASSQDHK